MIFICFYCWRLVALDGTYGQANRQWKYLTHALALLSSQSTSDTFSTSTTTSLPTPTPTPTPVNKSELNQKVESSAPRSVIKLPVVKLDLEEGQCDSVLAGIMHQPGKDKVCTYQVRHSLQFIIYSYNFTFIYFILFYFIWIF